MLEYALESSVCMCYEDAVLYCFFLEHNGHTDWHLPTYEEYRHSQVHNGSLSWWAGRQDPNENPIHRSVIPVRTAAAPFKIAPKEYWLDPCTYANAQLYCFMLSINGHTDWRIPTHAEHTTELIAARFSWHTSHRFKNNPREFRTLVPVRTS